MPIEFEIWKLDGGIEKIEKKVFPSEEELEDILEKNLDILGQNLLCLGRQVPTRYGKEIDILAIDEKGDTSVIELKKDKTSRDVVAQVIDYASWVKTLNHDDITNIYNKYNPDNEFEKAFDEKFGTSIPDEINENLHMMIVASKLDPSTERIVEYLSSDYGLPINVVFFSYFVEKGSRYLARSWLISPKDVLDRTETGMAAKRKREPWNGQDFYVNLGESEHRNWDDCVKYGFISAGQGVWYSKTLKSLFVGARIFVNLPRYGYAGVGKVLTESTHIKDFEININNKTIPLLKADLKAPKMDENADDQKLSEYVVGIEWIKTVDRDNAYWDKGMFAQQNTVCKLRNKFTLDKLITLFNLND